MGLVVDSGDSLAVKQWAKKVDAEIRAKDVLLDPAGGLLGDEGVVREKVDLKQTGKSVTMPYVYQTRSAGKKAGEQLIGNEQGLDKDSFEMSIGVLREAWSIDDGGYTDQVLSFDAFEQLAMNAADWAADRLSFALHAHAAGITLVTNDAYRLYNTITAPTYILRPNSGSAGALDETHRFDVGVIDDAIQLVKTVRPKIRPAKTKWGEKYVLCIHPDQTRALKESDSAWFAAMTASLQGGNQNSGVFTRVLGEFSDFLILESDYVPPGLNSGSTAYKANTRRAWVGGAGALALAFGRGWKDDPGYAANKWKFIKESHDFDEQRAFGVRSMLGAAKPTFTDPRYASDHDQGVVVIETWASHGSLSAATAFRDWTEAAPTVSVEA